MTNLYWYYYGTLRNYATTNAVVLENFKRQKLVWVTDVQAVVDAATKRP
jgi:hypothetical protein